LAKYQMGGKVSVSTIAYASEQHTATVSAISPVIDDNGMVHIEATLPSHQHLPSGVELSRMAVGSFAKSVNLWDEHNAPVTGMRFKRYKHLAERAIAIMTGAEEP